MPVPGKITGPHRPAQGLADADALAGEIERLGQLDLGQLRVQFRNRTGRIAPARISRSLLVRVLAYRIQTDAFGDIRTDVRRLLEGLAPASGTSPSRPGATSSPSRTRPGPRPGTVLAREWQGRMEHVMVLEDGFGWNGSLYPSLSAVAFAIAGTRWNGPRFFGLRDKGRDAVPVPRKGPEKADRHDARSRKEQTVDRVGRGPESRGVTASRAVSRARTIPALSPDPAGSEAHS